MNDNFNNWNGAMPQRPNTRNNIVQPTPNIMTQQGPPPVTDRYYIPGYLASQIGKNVQAEFVVGSNQFMDKAGILREVGVNYFVLEDYISHAMIMCDLYSVKFVTTL
jgi:hypothetical protein